MARFNNPLDNVRVAVQCNADWDQMIGNNRARFCGQCNLNVYNLSDMTRAEAVSLIGNHEGRLCVRYFRRKDGSILTQDCPVGLRALRRRMSSVARAVSSAVLSFIAGLGVYRMVSEFYPIVRPPFQGEVMGTIAVNPPLERVFMGDVAPQPPIQGRAIQTPMMGKVALIQIDGTKKGRSGRR